MDAKIACLHHNLRGAGQIAHATQGMIRRPARDQVRPAALLAQMCGQFLKGTFVLDGTFAFIEVKFGAQDVAEQDIPDFPVSRPGVPGPGTVQQRAFQSASGRCRRGLTGVVRLDRSDRDQRVCTGPQRRPTRNSSCDLLPPPAIGRSSRLIRDPPFEVGRISRACGSRGQLDQGDRGMSG